jgi:hypothetical protein
MQKNYHKKNRMNAVKIQLTVYIFASIIPNHPIYY